MKVIVFGTLLRFPLRFCAQIFSMLSDVSFRTFLVVVASIDLTNDQAYLYKIGKVIATGIHEPGFQDLKPGPTHHARWLTTASRILRLYVSKEHSSQKLQTLTTFIMKVYIPVFFGIKIDHDWCNGTKHFYNVLNMTRTYVPEALNTVVSAMKNNGHFGHTENVILTMITDSDSVIRKKGYDLIFQARKTHSQLTSEQQKSSRQPNRPYIRIETPKEFNLQCGHYSDILFWDEIDIFEPPITRSISDDALKAYASSAEIIHLPKIPSHSQATERYIQSLAEVVTKVAGHTNQEGYLKHT